MTISEQDFASGAKSGRPARNGFWLVALGAALWGMDPLFRILLLEWFTSAQIVFIEHVLLLVYAIPVLWIHRKELAHLSLGHIGALIFISWGGSALATILFTAALAEGNPNAVLLLQKLQPIFAVIMARMWLKEVLPKGFFKLLILALLGTYLLTFGWSLPVGHVQDVIQLGSLLSLGAAILWGGSTVMGRLLLGKLEYETVTSLRFVLALPFLFALTWMEGTGLSLNIPSVEWTAISLNFLLQALLPGLASLLLYYRGLSKIKASYATLAELSFPMVGVLINGLVFHQVITAAQFMGFILIWIALYSLSRNADVQTSEAG